MRRRRRRRAAALVVAALVVVAAVAAVALARGAYDTYPREGLLTAAGRPRVAAGAPAWTRDCLRRPPSPAERDCAHVSGRVVWIQRHDPDGDGDRHLFVVSRLHGRIIKLHRTLPVRRLPARGAWVEATGWLARGASGHLEVDSLMFRTRGTRVVEP